MNADICENCLERDTCQTPCALADAAKDGLYYRAYSGDATFSAVCDAFRERYGVSPRVVRRQGIWLAGPVPREEPDFA